MLHYIETRKLILAPWQLEPIKHFQSYVEIYTTMIQQKPERQ